MFILDSLNVEQKNKQKKYIIIINELIKVFNCSYLDM